MTQRIVPILPNQPYKRGRQDARESIITVGVWTPPAEVSHILRASMLSDQPIDIAWWKGGVLAPTRAVVDGHWRIVSLSAGVEEYWRIRIIKVPAHSESVHA